MKRRINQFLRTYFYFNTQEKKGLRALLVLIFSAQIVSLLYANWNGQEPSQVKIVPYKQLKLLVKEEGIEKEERGKVIRNFYDKASFDNKKFNYSKAEKDSVNDAKRRQSRFILEMNSADSAALVRLPKIGPVLAGRIVAYRDKLGGFHHLSQLCEVWGFKEDLLYDLQDRIRLDPGLVNKIPINTVALEQLKMHPYFKFSLSRNLVNYRLQHGVYAEPKDLRNIKTVNDSIYQLILPYLDFSVR